MSTQGNPATTIWVPCTEAELCLGDGAGSIRVSCVRMHSTARLGQALQGAYVRVEEHAWEGLFEHLHVRMGLLVSILKKNQASLVWERDQVACRAPESMSQSSNASWPVCSKAY